MEVTVRLGVRGVASFCAVFLAVFCVGSFVAAEYSTFIQNQIRIVHKEPGFTICYTQRAMPTMPKKVVVWASDDACWLRRVFAKPQPYSQIHTATAPAVGYFCDVVSRQIPAVVMLVFPDAAEKIGVTICFPAQKKAAGAQSDIKGAIVVTLYGSSNLVPRYLVEFFKTIARGPVKTSFFTRIARLLLVAGGGWLGLKKGYEYWLQKTRLQDFGQKQRDLGVCSHVAEEAVAPQKNSKKDINLNVEVGVTSVEIGQDIPAVPLPKKEKSKRRVPPGVRRTVPDSVDAKEKSTMPKTKAPAEIFVDLTLAQREAIDVCGCSKAIRIHVQKSRDWLGVLVSRSAEKASNVAFLQKLLEHVESEGVGKHKLSSFYQDLDYALRFDAAIFMVNQKRGEGYSVRFGRKLASSVTSAAKDFATQATSAFVATGYKAMNFFKSKVSPETGVKLGVEIGSQIHNVYAVAASALLFDVHDRRDSVILDWLLLPDGVDYKNAIKAASGLTERTVTSFYEFDAVKISHLVVGSYSLLRHFYPGQLSEHVLSACHTEKGLAAFLCGLSVQRQLERDWADYVGSGYKEKLSPDIQVPSAIVINIPALLAATA